MTSKNDQAKKDDEVQEGVYAGIPYLVLEKDGKKFISLQPDAVGRLAELGADLKPLSDIGDGDPEIIMENMFDSIPKEEEVVEAEETKN